MKKHTPLFLGLTVFAFLKAFKRKSARARNANENASNTNGSQNKPEQSDNGTCPDPAAQTGKLAGLDYRQEMVGGASPSEMDVPIVIYLHSQFSEASIQGAFPGLQVPARVIMPLSPKTENGRRVWMVNPATANNEETLIEMASLGTDLGRFLDALAVCYPEPPIVLTGHSQGGMASLLLATRRPEMLDAVISVGGWLPDSLFPPEDPRLPPIYGMHGMQDEVIPYTDAAKLYEALQAAGHPALLMGVKDEGHGVRNMPWSDALEKALMKIEEDEDDLEDAEDEPVAGS